MRRRMLSNSRHGESKLHALRSNLSLASQLPQCILSYTRPRIYSLLDLIKDNLVNLKPKTQRLNRFLTHNVTQATMHLVMIIVR